VHASHRAAALAGAPARREAWGSAALLGLDTPHKTE
jgi:hypothetical protein